MTKDSPRQLSFDVLRVLAILFVVLIHTHIGNLTEDSNWLEILIFYFAKLGVPLFVMISGALLLSKKEAAEVFYKKRANKVLLPWIVWSAIYLVYKMSTADLPFSLIETIKEYIVVFLSDFWFMPLILGVYALTPYLRTIIVKHTSLLMPLLGWFFLTSVLPLVYLSPLFPGSSSAGILTLIISFCGYFILGWYLQMIWQKKVSTAVLICVLLISSSVYLYFSYLLSSNVNLHFFAQQDYFSPPIVLGSISLYLVLLKTFERVKVKSKYIELLSNYTFGIFLCHVIVSKLLSQFFIPSLYEVDGSVLIWLIRAVLVYSSSAVLIALATKVPYLKKAAT